jgi:uncharacterized protein YndB with AHSA1/START domain
VTLELRFARVIAAPVEKVFAAFTSPAGQVAFYGQDDPGWIVRSECDLRVGGAWTVAFGSSPSELYRHHHVFEVIEPPHRLLLATTEIRLDGTSFASTIEFTFEDQNGNTLMTMVQTGFPTEELRDEHRRGVPNAFTRLERHLARSRPD